MKHSRLRSQPGRVGRFAAALLWAIVAASAAAASPNAQSAEYEIKAAFLCKFGNYVEWPSQPSGASEIPFGIGVVASDLVVDELTRVARGQTVNGRPIVVRRLVAGDSLSGLDILFVARSHTAHLADTLAAVKGQAILTVTESDPATPLGGIVNFVVVADKVKFDIALQQAEQNNLKISARLLSVARAVDGRPSQ
jgi:hypothetical protein